MVRDSDDDALPMAAAPPAWTETMIQAAIEDGFVVQTGAGPSVTAAIEQVAAAVGRWADDPKLTRTLEALLAQGKIALDPPLTRADRKSVV